MGTFPCHARIAVYVKHVQFKHCLRVTIIHISLSLCVYILPREIWIECICTWHRAIQSPSQFVREALLFGLSLFMKLEHNLISLGHILASFKDISG